MINEREFGKREFGKEEEYDEKTLDEFIEDLSSKLKKCDEERIRKRVMYLMTSENSNFEDAMERVKAEEEERMELKGRFYEDPKYGTVRKLEDIDRESREEGPIQ